MPTLFSRYTGQTRVKGSYFKVLNPSTLIALDSFFQTEQVISVPSIPSEEAFGVPTTLPGGVTISPPGIASAEAFGTAELIHEVAALQTIIMPSIGSGEAFGAPVVIPGEVIISVPSIASTEQFSSPVLAQSGGPQTITVPSISSEEAFGALFTNLGPPPQTITIPSIPSAEAFGSLVIEQIGPEIAIVMPSIISAEEFGNPTLILGSEPIYLPPPDTGAEPGAGGWEVWTSGLAAYISRNGFECFITGLWYPGESTYISYGRIKNPVTPKVDIPKNDSRRASVAVHLDDPIVRNIRPYSRMLRVHYRGRLIYWGVLNLPEYNLEENLVHLNSIDPSIRLYRHFLRLGDLLNVQNQPVGSTGEMGSDGKGVVYVSTAGLRLLRDAGNNLDEQTARGVPGPGIVNGYDDWHLELGDVDGLPDRIEVTRGDRVLDKMKDLSNQITGPDFEFEPVSGQPGAYCRLNTYYKQGTDKTDSVAFHYGTGKDNLDNIEISYGEEFVTHVHTLDRGAKYRYTEANVTSSEESGIYVWWDATDYDVAKLTPAMRESVLRAAAKGVLDVYGRPLESYTLHCKIETNSSPWYMRNYAIGDIITIAGVKNYFKFQDEVRINDISLEQIDDAGNIKATILVSPTIPTIDIVQNDPDVRPVIDLDETPPVIVPPDTDPPPVEGSTFTTLILDEQFNGESVDTGIWSRYNGPGHAGNGLRDPAAFSVQDGQLVVTAWWDGFNIHSGGMAHRGSYTYFRAESRVRTEYDSTQQLSGLTLTWPDSNRWPQDGENDWYETGLGHGVNRNPFASFIHHPHEPGPTQQTYVEHAANGTEWHTMTMEVASDHLTIWRDGVVIANLTDPSEWAHVPHHVCLQLDAFSNNPLAGPVRMFVDYCKVWI